MCGVPFREGTRTAKTSQPCLVCIAAETQEQRMGNR